MMVEYMVYMAGPRGFEVIKETAATIGQVRGERSDNGE